mgnify:CR=1 FL=1
MSIYQKQNFVGGVWVKGSEVVTGSKVKIVSETNPSPSKFTNKDGTVKMQDVAKVRFQGIEEVKNMNLNRATLNGLVDAFGEDSKKWIGQVLTAITEKMVVGGKRVTAVYLLADGYELKEDEGGYMIIINPAKETVQVAPSDGLDEVNPEDIPF